MKSDPTTPRHAAVVGALARDVEMLKREKRQPISHDWVYVGTYPTDPHTTVDSPPFQNSWANVPGGDGHAVPARFRISPDDNLEVEGSFGGGVSGTVAWTLPTGWRRDYRKLVVISDDDHNVLVCVVDAATSATPGVVTPYEVLTVGATGAVGAAGNTVLSGAGAPGGGIGTDGDFYINTSTDTIYGPKTGGAWGSGTSLVGATGATGPAGPTGPAGASTAWHDGTGAPSAGLGANGDYYLNDANGDVYFKASGSWSVVANIKGATGSTGSAGAAGSDGGLKFTYSTNTASSDPTSGKLKFDSATLSAITSLRISETDGDGNGLASFIQSWDDSTSAARATITLVKAGAPSNILIFQVAGPITDNGTWDSCTIAYVASSGTFSDGDVVRVLVSRTGDKGDTGATGSTGSISPEDANAIVAMEVFA